MEDWVTHLYQGEFFTLGTIASFCEAKNRYVFDYESSPQGIIRTLKQPLGRYYIATLGVTGSLSLFNRKFDINASAYYNHYHNGLPYNISKNSLRVFLSAYAYLNKFSFSGGYYSAMAETGGFMTGFWMKIEGSHYISAGWSYKNINIKLSAINFARWNWKSETRKLKSKYYDFNQTYTNAFAHASFSLSLTYVLNYGKKIDSRNELSIQSRPSSGILE